MHYAKLLVVPAFILSCLGVLPAQAAEPALEKAIHERITALESAWAKGDAKFIATQVYGRDALIHGEGQKEIIHTPEGVQGIIGQLVAESKSVKLTVYSLKALGSNAANTWVTWHVTPKAEGEQPFEVRALFVWTRGREGWRIRSDMYSLGSM